MAWIVRGEEPSFEFRILAFPACTLLAWLTTKLIENPLRFGGNGKVKTIGLFCVMAMLGGIGYLIFCLEGIPERITQKTDENKNHTILYEGENAKESLTELQILQKILLEDHRTNSGFFLENGQQNPCHNIFDIF